MNMNLKRNKIRRELPNHNSYVWIGGIWL